MKFTLESAKSIRNLKTSGTIFPCSKHSARFAIKKLNIQKASLIIELGCGTGIFTKEILKQKNPASRFFALEINKNLAKETKKRFPSAIIYNDCAENLTKYIGEIETQKADCIISTLPWAIFPADQQIKILNEIYNSLKEKGEFITISYILSNRFKGGKRFNNLLKSRFSYVKKTKHVLENIPPVFFYYCRK